MWAPTFPEHKVFTQDATDRETVTHSSITVASCTRKCIRPYHPHSTLLCRKLFDQHASSSGDHGTTWSWKVFPQHIVHYLRIVRELKFNLWRSSTKKWFGSFGAISHVDWEKTTNIFGLCRILQIFRELNNDFDTLFKYAIFDKELK